MGKGYSIVESELPILDPSITSSVRFKRLENQFKSWSIVDVQTALEKFKTYKHSSFENAEDARAKLLTDWPEFYSILDSVTLEHSKASRAAARKRRHPGCAGYAMKKDPSARPPAVPDAYAEDGSVASSGDGANRYRYTTCAKPEKHC